MGFFDKDDSGASSEANSLIDQQFKQNQAELKQKRDAIFQQRIDIIKSQGQQNWGSGMPASSSSGGLSGLSSAPRRQNVGRDML